MKNENDGEDFKGMTSMYFPKGLSFEDAKSLEMGPNALHVGVMIHNQTGEVGGITVDFHGAKMVLPVAHAKTIAENALKLIKEVEDGTLPCLNQHKN